MHADDDSLLDAMRAGARSYLLKGAEREEITRAVLTVAAGGTAFGGDVGPRIAAYAARPPTPPRASSSPSSAAASTRCSSIRPRDSANHEIAAHLFLSEKAVRNHLAKILVKLQVRDRAAAVARARDRGLSDALR